MQSTLADPNETCLPKHRWPIMNVVEWHNDAVWDQFVLSARDSTVAHLSGWHHVMTGAYGLKNFSLAAVDGGTIQGVLPLTLIQSRLLGNCLVSMPFLDYGGVCSNGNQQAETALVQAAQEIALKHSAALSLRYLHDPHLTLPCWDDKVTMFLDLPPSEDITWKRLPSERRNRIRKGQKFGLQGSLHGIEGLNDFYKVFAENMRDLGSPVHGQTFFREIMRCFDKRAQIMLIRLGAETVGAAIMLSYNGVLSIPWVSSSRAFFEKYPNQVLYWEAMQYGIASGCQVLDFGRCSKGSGTFEAKRQWGAKAVQLHWHYYPETTRPPGGDVKRYAWFANMWKRLPLPVANAIGPWLRQSIPN